MNHMKKGCHQYLCNYLHCLLNKYVDEFQDESSVENDCEDSSNEFSKDSSTNEMNEDSSDDEQDDVEVRIWHTQMHICAGKWIKCVSMCYFICT